MDPVNRPDSSDQPQNPKLPLFRLGLVFAIALAFASTAPAPLLPAVMAGLLLIAAMASSALALITREAIWVPRLTRWDEAAILFVAGHLIGWTADPQLVTQTLERMQAAQ